MKKALAGFLKISDYRRWGIPPRPEGSIHYGDTSGRSACQVRSTLSNQCGVARNDVGQYFWSLISSEYKSTEIETKQTKTNK
jgi:hypothetical protein